jgi:hypothetical protein
VSGRSKVCFAPGSRRHISVLEFPLSDSRRGSALECAALADDVTPLRRAMKTCDEIVRLMARTVRNITDAIEVFFRNRTACARITQTCGALMSMIQGYD